MQLLLTLNELKLVAKILEEDGGRPEKKESRARLLNRIIDRDLALGIDELEDLEEVLTEKYQSQRQGSAEGPEREQELALLQEVLDKVTEACAMG